MTHDIISCFIDNDQYIANVRRTYLYLSNYDNELKVSWFDITQMNIKSNKLFINQNNIPSLIIIEGNNIRVLYNTIHENIKKLRYDIQIGNLVIDNKDISNSDWECSICLENHKHEDLIKLKCCNSIYHRSCIDKYWKTNSKIKCPLCGNNQCPFL